MRFIFKKIKNYILSRKIQIKTNSYLKNDVKLNFNTILEGKNKIYEYSDITNSFIGLGTYISNSTNISYTKVGRFCSIGPNVSIVGGNHPTSMFVSTHPAFFSTKKQAGFTFVKEDIFKELSYVDNENRYLVEIGNDVWIGANVTILNGVRIKDGAIIAAGSVVTKDVEAYAIYGGIPARKLKMRFGEKDVEYLLNLKWWEKDIDWIKTESSLFRDINNFSKEILNER